MVGASVDLQCRVPEGEGEGPLKTSSFVVEKAAEAAKIQIKRGGRLSELE